MEVVIFKLESIQDYIASNSGSKKGLERFVSIIEKADWNNFEDIKYSFGNSMDTLPKCSRVVFDISGNKYRLIGKLNFRGKRVRLWIKFIGTHAEYDKVDACTVDMFK